MLHHLRPLNPFASISNEAEALTAARAGAVGAFICAAQTATVAGLFFFQTTLGGLLVAKAWPLAALIVIIAGLFTWFFAALGVIQWRRLTQIIPLLLLLLTILNLASIVVSTPRRPSSEPHILMGCLVAVQLLLFTAGTRGGKAIRRLREMPAP